MKAFSTLFATLLVLVFTQNTNAQTYVNTAATGNNDGTSWADAYPTLHDALENYSAGDEIWVAAGTYLPQQPSAWPGEPENTFYIYQDLQLYGGFDGTETMLSERDPAANVTTLSGDLNGDDIDDDFETNRADNATSVVFVDTVITAATFIDGFTIRNGHAEGDTAIVHQTIGGGMMAWGSPQIGQCRFTQNYANVAGGLYLRDATSAEASVTDCIFEDNAANEAGGGLIVVTLDSSKVVSISNCQFIGNRAVRLAGGLGVRSSSVELTGCSFTQNSNEAAGGGIFFFVLDEDGSDYQFSLTECDFTENVSANGGAFYYETNASGENDLTFTSCNFTGNQAITTPLDEFPEAGALEFLFFGEDNTSLDSIIISECVFQENTTERMGGALTFWNGQGTDNYLEISNSTFTENSSVTFGGGIHLSTYGGDHMEVNITECAFANNSSTDGGGVSFFSTNGEQNNFNITSCDFTGNQATELSPGDTPDGGGIYVNFQTPGDILQNNTVTVEDCILQGNSAERRGGGIMVFNNIGNDNRVAVSNCQMSGNTSDDAGGGMFLGNFGGTDFELNVSGLDFTNNSSNHGGAFYYASNNGDNNNLLFSDCNFTGNTAITSPTFQFPDGGALGFQYTTGNPTNDHILLENCVLENNSAERHGGGVAFFNSHGTDNLFEVNDCQFSENAVDGVGGGFYLVNNGATNFGVNISGSDFSDNTAASVGGGVQFQNNNGTDHHFLVSDCNFSNNHADVFGGGFRMESQVPTSLTFANCLFDGNSADIDGGGLEVVHWMESDGETIITKTDFLNNTSGNHGAGLNFALEGQGNGSLSVEGSLFSGNVNDATGDAELGAGGLSLNNLGNGMANVDIQSSIFENNSSEDGAGAINLYKISTATTDVVSIENCLVNGNTGGEFGGGIGLNGNIDLTLTNNTIADNSNIGVVLADGKVAMRNNIVHNPGTDDFQSSLFEENVVSLGGNLVGDATIDTHLNSADQSGVDPIFEAGTFQLSQNSSAVDAGVLPDNPPATDLAGNDRIQGGCIDIGALESPHDAGTSCLTTDSREVLADQSTVFIYPNPVSASASISIENNWKGELNFRIVNALGQEVFHAEMEKFDRSATLEFDASDLPEGMYRVLVSGTGQSPAPATMAVSSFVKI